MTIVEFITSNISMLSGSVRNLFSDENIEDGAVIDLQLETSKFNSTTVSIYIDMLNGPTDALFNKSNKDSELKYVIVTLGTKERAESICSSFVIIDGNPSNEREEAQLFDACMSLIATYREKNDLYVSKEELEQIRDIVMIGEL